MPQVDLDSSALPDDEFGPHGVVVACFILFIGVEIGGVASSDPHMEPSVVSP